MPDGTPISSSTPVTIVHPIMTANETAILASAARLDTAAANKDFGMMNAELATFRQTLSGGAKDLTGDEQTRVADILINAHAVAKKDGEWSTAAVIGDILMGIITLGIFPIYKAVHNSPANNAEKTSQTLGTLDQFDVLTKGGTAQDAKWLHNAFDPIGTAPTATSPIAKTYSAATPSDTAHNLQPADYNAMSPGDRAQMMKVIAQASTDAQTEFFTRLFAAGGIADADARFMLNFDPKVVAGAVDAKSFAALSDDSKTLITRAVCRATSGFFNSTDDDTVRAFANKVAGSTTSDLDIDSRMQLIETLVSGNSADGDSVVALFGPLAQATNIAEPIFAKMTTDQLSQLASALSSSQEGKLKELASIIVTDPNVTSALKNSLVRYFKP